MGKRTTSEIDKMMRSLGYRRYKDTRYPRGCRWCKPEDVIGTERKGKQYATISKKDRGSVWGTKKSKKR